MPVVYLLAVEVPSWHEWCTGMHPQKGTLNKILHLLAEHLTLLPETSGRSWSPGQSPSLICNKNSHDVFLWWHKNISPKIDIEIITTDMSIAGTKQNTCTYFKNASLLHRRWYVFWYAQTSVNALLGLPWPLYLSGIFTIFAFGCFLHGILKELTRSLSTPCPYKVSLWSGWNTCLYTCNWVSCARKCPK